MITSIISLILYNYNSTLELQLTKRDKIIQRIANTDSVIVEKTKDYAKSIKDFNSEIIFEQNGKNLTSSEIVKVFNQIADDNNKLVSENNNLTMSNYKLRDSLLNCKRKNISQQQSYRIDQKKISYNYLDSISDLNFKLSTIKSNYGIDYQFKKTGLNMKKLEKQTTMVDSAIVLFPYYKHTLTKEGNVWYIETDKNYRKAQKDKQRNSVEKPKQ